MKVTPYNLKPDIDYNPHDGTWEIGWRDQDDNSFCPFNCGYDTEEEVRSDLFRVTDHG